jgi:hypothetical protein
MAQWLVAAPWAAGLPFASPAQGQEISAAGMAEARTAVHMASFAPASGFPLGSLHVADAAQPLLGGTDPALSVFGGVAAPAGTLAELAGSRGPYIHPVRFSLDKAVDPGERPAVAPGAHGPSLPLLVICALAVLGFMARRNIDFVAP